MHLEKIGNCRKLKLIKVNKYILLLGAAIYHITTACHSSEPESFKHKQLFSAFRSDCLVALRFWTLVVPDES